MDLDSDDEDDYYVDRLDDLQGETLVECKYNLKILTHCQRYN